MATGKIINLDLLYFKIAPSDFDQHWYVSQKIEFNIVDQIDLKLIRSISEWIMIHIKNNYK